MAWAGRWSTYECEHCGLTVWREEGFTRKQLQAMHRVHFPSDCPSSLARQINSRYL